MGIKTTGVRYDLIARDGASKVFKSVGGQAGKLDNTFGKLAKTVAFAGAAMAGGLAAGLAVSAEKAVQFQTEMTKIQTMAGATAGDVKKLSAQVLELGKTTQQGPQALSESLYHLKSVGMDNVDAMKALKTSADLAAVGGANLEDTTNALAGAWRTGIKGATNFGQAASTVNAIIGAGNMSMEDLTAALGTGILPTAKTFGLTFSQVGAAIALFTDEGVDSASAATRLRMSISLLAAGSPAANKQLKKIGLTTDKLGDAMRSKKGIIGAISLLKDHLDKSGLSATHQAALLSRAFGGGKSSSAILSMVNNLDVLEKKQAQVNASMGKYGPAVAAQRKTAAAQLALIRSNLQVFAIKTGNVLLPPLTDFVTYINRTAVPEMHKFGDEMVTRFIPVDKIEAKVKTAATFISNLFSGLKGPKKPPVVPIQPKVVLPKNLPPDALNFGAAIHTTIIPKYQAPKNIPPSLLRFGLAPHPADKIKVKSQAEQMGDSVRTALSGGIADAAKSVDWGSIGKIVGQGLGSAFDWVVAHGSDLSKKAAKAIGGIDWVDVGKEFGSVALPMAIGFVDNIFAPLFTTDFWSKHWLDTMLAAMSVVPIGKLADVGGTMLGHIPWGKLTDVLDRVPWGKVFGWARWIGDTTGPAVKAAGHFIDQLGTGFREGFSSKFPKIAGWFSDQLYILPDRLGDLGRLMRRKAVTLVKDVGDSLAKNVPGLGNKFVQGALKILGRFTFYQTGIHLVEGLFSGVWAQMQGVGKWAKATIVDPFVNWVKGLFGVHSPSTVFASIGGYLILGLKSGVAGAMVGAGKWLYGTVISPILGSFAGAGSWLYYRGSDTVRGLLSGAWSIAKGVGGWVRANVVSPVTSPFAKAGSWLRTAGGDLVGGLKGGLVGGVKDIGGWLKKNLVDPIVKSVKGWFGIKSPSTVFAGIGGHLVGGLMKGLSATNGLAIAKTVFGDLPSALAHIVSKGLVKITALPSKALSALSHVGGEAQKLVAGLFGGGGGGGDLVGQWGTDVRTVLGMLGAPVDAFGPVLQRIRMESGGNPNAINLTDSNAKAGHPSQGLMQTIPSTFNTYAGPFRSRGITDPMASIYAGVNYAMHRYGKNWISVMTRPGGYAAGGLAPIGETAWVGERGAELMQVTAKGTRIYNHKDSLALAKGAGIKIPGYAAGTVATGQVAAAERRVKRAEAALTAAKHRSYYAHTKAQRHADALAVEAAQKRLAAAKKELSNANKAVTASKNVANALANGFLKTIETGTASAIATAIKGMNTKLQAASAGGMVAGNLRTSSRLQALANKKASIASQITAAKGYAADKAADLGDFLGIGDTSATSIQGLIGQMNGQQRSARSFAALVAQLSKRGLNKSLLSQLADQGPGGNLQTLFTNVSAGDIKQLNALAASGGKLTTSFGNQMADAMYDSGAQAGKGFLTGLIAQEAALQAEMNKLAAGMVNAIKKKLGIKSPSRVFRDQVGKQIAHGIAAGVALHTPKATGEVQRMADTMAAIRARNTGVRAGGNGSTREPQQVHEWNVEVHFRDERLKELIDVRVEPKIRASEKRGAYRQKVGAA